MIINFKRESSEVDTLRILLHGPVGGGKSSFFKSVDNALQGRITTRAQAQSGYTEGTFTVTNEGGTSTEDIIKLLNGHINSGYTFNPVMSITEDDTKYKKTPSLKDKIHCLVAVLPADALSLENYNIFKKMKVVREKARDLDIPQVIIMTKVDEVCPLVKDDLKNIYTSKKIKQKMEECSNILGVTVDCIYPVKNYHEENSTKATANILILDALKNILNFANDHVEDKLERE